jgi:Tetracyclin repressor-like, C-terminal domain/Bacterial regulatory proteins, tetR family
MRGHTSGRPERDASPEEPAVEHELRRAILAAAIEELQKWSFERFNVETVADRAAVDPNVVHRLWNSTEQLMVDALVDHCDQIVIVPDTGSVRSDLAGHLASLAEYFNTAIGRSLLRTGVIGPKNWAPASVRSYFWKARVDAVRVVFERAESRDEIRHGIDHNTALQLATGPLFLRGLYSNDPIDTTQLCTLIADLVWRAVRRDDVSTQVAIPT